MLFRSARDLGGRQRDEHAQRAQQVDGGNHRRRHQQRPRHRAPRVLDLVAHEGRRLGTRPGEGDRREEHEVAQGHAGQQAAGRHRRRRPEGDPGHAADSDEHEGGQPAGDAADVVQTNWPVISFMILD